MKIGFNLESLIQNENLVLCENSAEYEYRLKRVKFIEGLDRVFEQLKKENHQLFVFSPTKVELDDIQKLRIKKNLIQKFHKNGIDVSKLAIVKKEDLVEVTRRNHIDISVDFEEKESEEISSFTDSVLFSSEKNPEDLLKEIFENIEKNRQFILDSDAKPLGLPSEDQLWLKKYRVGDIKWSHEEMSPYDRLVTSNMDWEDEIAIEFYGTKMTYKQFFDKIDELYLHMKNSGIQKGVKVPIVVANTPESFITLYALYKTKATIVPIFALSTESDFKEKVEKIKDQNLENGFETNMMFISDLVCGKFQQYIPNEYQVISLPVTTSMPKPLGILFHKVVFPKLGIKPVSYNDQVISYSSYLNQKIDYVEEEENNKFENDYVAVQLYTGGTVRPKSVKLSAENIDVATKQFYNDRFDFRRGDKIAAFMPLNHSFGLIIGTHVAASLGVVLDIIMKINFNRLDKLFLKDKVNLFGGIPNMFPAIRNNKNLQKANLSHVKYILSGGSSIDDTEKEKTTKFFQEHQSKAEVHDGYGLTESAGGIIYDGVPNIGTNVKIVSFGTTDELDYEQVGELCLSGPQIMLGYDEEELTEKALKKHSDGKIWLHTGDYGIIHEDGEIEVIGRMDRMIKVNGEQVVLDKLEEAIHTLPFVEKSAVVKKEDSKRGFVPVAFITLAQGYVWNEETQNMLESFYKAKFTSFSRPRFTEVVEEFPLTNVGKIDIKTLEERVNTLEKYQKVYSK